MNTDAYMLLPFSQVTYRELQMIHDPICDGDERQVYIPIKENEELCQMVMEKVIHDLAIKVI